MKDDSDDVKLAFTLNRVVLGHLADGEAITSCVVQVSKAAAPPPPANQASPVRHTAQPNLPDASSAFLAALRSLIDKEGTAPNRRYKLIPQTARVMRQADLQIHAAALAVGGNSDEFEKA